MNLAAFTVTSRVSGCLPKLSPLVRWQLIDNALNSLQSKSAHVMHFAGRKRGARRVKKGVGCIDSGYFRTVELHEKGTERNG